MYDLSTQLYRMLCLESRMVWRSNEHLTSLARTPHTLLSMPGEARRAGRGAS